MMTPAAKRTAERVIGVVALLLAALGPLIFSDYWVSFILTQAFLMGIAAASLIFLSAYGGMVSLAQGSLAGVAGFALGNMVTRAESKGLNLGWDPWLSVLLAILITVAIGLLFGALASRSTGIYFLMITLTLGVLVYYFFGQVTEVSGFSGISGIARYAPDLVGGGTDPDRLYYTALIVAALVYVLIRFILRTPFGYALQGVRDDPVRMASLGYNVTLHRTLAFGLGAFIAALSGVLYVWWNGQIDPASINLQNTVDLLIIAVIGGLARIEGAWLGALAFIVINNYVRDVSVPILGGSFNTVIGFIFLAIVLVSPDGLMGIWERVTTGRRRPAFGATIEPAAATSGGTERGTSGQVAGHGTTEPPEEGGGK
ncbi:MAG: branched-chain amino acid ABC transporter permease [Gaiellaceae bacterium]|jgi:branched-chain amino acid transport system permease protein